MKGLSEANKKKIAGALGVPMFMLGEPSIHPVTELLRSGATRRDADGTTPIDVRRLLALDRRGLRDDGHSIPRVSESFRLRKIISKPGRARLFGARKKETPTRSLRTESKRRVGT